jgi:hypothetical protein
MAVNAVRFGVGELDENEQLTIVQLVRTLRQRVGDFEATPTS